MNQNQHFFQAFFGPQMQQPQQQIPEYIIHNETVLEIINNWGFVKEFMKRHRRGTLTQVDILEQTWYSFLVSKGIDIRYYLTEEEFKKDHWITLA